MATGIFFLTLTESQNKFYVSTNCISYMYMQVAYYKSFRQTLTPSISHTQVWKSPDVTQPHAITYHGQHVVQLGAPLSPLHFRLVAFNVVRRLVVRQRFLHSTLSVHLHLDKQMLGAMLYRLYSRWTGLDQFQKSFSPGVPYRITARGK